MMNRRTDTADPESATQPEYKSVDLVGLRLVALNRALWVLSPLGTFVVLVAIADEYSKGRLVMVGFYLGLLMILVLIATLQRLGYIIRASTLLAVLYLLSVSELLLFGIVSLADVTFLMFVLFAGVFFTFRIGIAALCLSLVTIVCIASFYIGGAITVVRVQQSISLDISNWFTTSMLYTLLAMCGLMMFQLLINKLEKSLKSHQQLVIDLQATQATLLQKIADHKLTSEELQTSDDYVQTVIESTVDGILVVDKSGNIKHANNRFMDMWCIPDELRGTDKDEELLKHVVGQLKDPEAFRDKVDTLYKNNIEDFDVLVFKDGRIFERLSTPIIRHGIYDGRVWSFRDITKRKEAETERVRLMMAIEQAEETIVITDPEGVIQYANPAFERSTGYTCEEAIGQNPSILKSGKHSSNFYEGIWTALRRNEKWSGRIVNRRKDGTLYDEEMTISSVCDDTGITIGYVAVKHDITEEIKLETQLRQSQKMEAVGQLAGGIAHDFNNLLQVILGYGELALNGVDADSSIHQHLQETLKAAERAKVLVKQLLAFSRRQVLDTKDVDLNDVITDMIKMIRRVIGEHITLDTIVNPELGIVCVDPGQVGQILLNLCVNARDAMPKGGTITIETHNTRIDEAFCKDHPWATEGHYALMSVSDNGCGMSEENIEQIFDPFFTTKDLGEGTGLGLATVYGLVKQHKGLIHVYSEVDKGSTFKVYLPLVESAALSEGKKPVKPMPGGTETILLAEDDKFVRDLTVTILENAGYSVLLAVDGEEAMRLFNEHTHEINIAILDVVMPKVGGHAVYEHIQKARPELHVLFSSGYSMSAIHTNFVLAEGLQLLQKPYQREELLSTIRKVLDNGQE